MIDQNSRVAGISAWSFARRKAGAQLFFVGRKDCAALQISNSTVGDQMKTVNRVRRISFWILILIAAAAAFYFVPILMKAVAPKDDSVQGELAFEIGSSIQASTGAKAVTIPGSAGICSQDALPVKLSSCIVIGIREPASGVLASVYGATRSAAISRARELASEGRLSEPAIVTIAFYRSIDESFDGGLLRNNLQRHFIETTSISIICKEGKCS